MNQKRKREEEYGRQWLERCKFHTGQEYHTRYQDRFLESLPIKGEMTILECGSGNGDLTVRIGKKHLSRNLTYVCLDVSVVLLKYIMTRADIPLNVNTKTVQATSETIPVHASACDIVFALSVLWYVPQPKKAIFEMYRVVKPGGVLSFDIISILHPGGLAGAVSNLFTFRTKNAYRMRYLVPSVLAADLRVKGYSVEYEGFFPLFPVSLPLVGNAFNVFKYCNWIPKPWRGFSANFCFKVVFTIKK